MKESHSVADPDSKPRRLPKGSYMLGSRPPNCDILFSQTDRLTSRLLTKGHLFSLDSSFGEPHEA
jgi:hypothetical protein